MSLQQIAQNFLGTKDRLWKQAAEALADIARQFSVVYEDMGWFEISGKSSGIRKDALETPLLRILGGKTNNISIAELRSLDGRFVILLDASNAQGIINIESRNPATGESMQITPNLINIFDVDGQLLAALTAQQDIGTTNDQATLLLQSNGGALNSLTAQTNPTEVAVRLFFEAGANDFRAEQIAQVAEAYFRAAYGSSLEIKGRVTSTTVVFTVANASATTTVKPESVGTNRLGIGVAPPSVDGRAVIGSFLGVVATAPTGAEVLKVTGDTNLVGALDVSAAITNPVLTAKYVIALLGGTLSSQTAAATRTDLDVYTKAETNTAIATAIAAMTITAVGDHTHGGAVAPDGGHSHTHTP